MAHTNLMTDLETLGNHADAKIISIGAVFFGKDGLGEPFYRVINPEKSSGSIDASTVVWWMQQSDSARQVFKDKSAVSELLALMEFQSWCTSHCAKKDLKIWGNGASFDNVILRSALERNRLEVPWEFWNDRCFRTYKALHPRIKYEQVKGVKHNALDDAVAQANHMIKLLNR